MKVWISKGGAGMWEAPKHIYSWAICCASYAKAKEGQELLKLGSAAMNTKGRRTHRQDPNSHRLQGREERRASQGNWGSKLHPLCLSDSSTPTTHMLETIAAFRVMSTSETFQDSARIWMLGGLNKFICPIWCWESLLFFFSLNSQPLSPLEKF